MIGMNVFTSNAFEATELSGLVQTMDYNPQMLGGMNLFAPKPVRQKHVFIDQKDDTLSLLPFSERGTSPKVNDNYTRKAISFEVPRIAVQDTIMASEIAGLRATGSETELMTVQSEVADRLASMRQKVEYTKEFLRLAAVQGKVLDPKDGSVMYDYFAEFGITEEAAVSFAFTTATTDVAEVCRQLVRSIQRSAKGGWVMGTSRVQAIVGDDFFDALVKHPSVKEKWLNWTAAAELRNVDPFTQFDFGGITFHNYRGSDDNSEVAVAPTESKFFISGGNEVFSEVMAPADEFIPFLGARGQSVYAIQSIDAEYQNNPRFVKYDMYSYPLFMCSRPNTLRKGVAA